MHSIHDDAVQSDILTFMLSKYFNELLIFTKLILARDHKHGSYRKHLNSIHNWEEIKTESIIVLPLE